jgi:molybdopterin-binding protein
MVAGGKAKSGTRRAALTFHAGRTCSSRGGARPDRPRLAQFGPCYLVEMAEYRIGQAAELLGVSSDTVRRWADAGRVRTSLKGGRRYVDGAALARLATEIAGEQRRDNPRGQSARNRFIGIITRVTKDGVAAQVEIQSGPHRFVALITREAADELELEEGMVADAVVKATNVGVEIPAQF